MIVTKRTFRSYEDYSNYYINHEHYHNEVEVVELGLTVFADCVLRAKTWQLALTQFFEAISDDNRFDGWYRRICRCVKHGCWKHESKGYYFFVKPYQDAAVSIPSII